MVVLWTGSSVAQDDSLPDTRPTIAVMYFNNSALVRHADYEPLRKGIMDVLTTELQANPAIRLVERDDLQRLLEEQNLDSTSRVDQETASRIGKILGARYMIFGGFLVDMKGTMRLDAHAVNVETSRIEYVATKTAKEDNLLDVLANLAVEMNAGMKLPPIPSGTRPASGRAGSAGGRYRALMLYSQGLAKEDEQNPTQALSLYRAALAEYPGFHLAQKRLSSITRPAP